MGSIVIGIKTLPRVAVGFVLLLGLVQLEVAVEPNEPRVLPQHESTIAVQEMAGEVKIELPGDVLFDFDQWDIRPDAEPTLRQVTEIIQQ